MNGTNCIRIAALTLALIATGNGILRAGDVLDANRPIADAPTYTTYEVVGGTVTIALDVDGLSSLRSDVFGDHELQSAGVTYTASVFDVVGADATVFTQDGAVIGMEGELSTIGALIISRSEDQTDFVVGNLGITLETDGFHAIDSLDTLRDVFHGSYEARVDSDRQILTLTGQVELSQSLAALLGDISATGQALGFLEAELTLFPTDQRVSTSLSDDDGGAVAGGGNPGYDVMVGDLNGLASWGTDGSISAYSIGTTSCNAGTLVLPWIANGLEHPVIPQHMYRLKDGRFEQIGISWLKHGFCALQGNLCQFGCQAVPGGCPQALGVGCSDPYSASLNGSSGGTLGPRSEVNPWTGDYIWPPGTASGGSTTIRRRIQVNINDLNPALNPGALYFGEAIYVHLLDAGDLNHYNNASYRRFVIGSLGGNGAYNVSWSGSTVRELPAIMAWPAHDPDATVVTADIPGEGRFYVGYSATDNGDATWHYEYAMFNLHSDRAAGSFSIPIGDPAGISNIEFHAPQYHSGEPYPNIDWTVSTSGGAITWSSPTFAQNEDAKSLRWGTMYTFRFDSTSPPTSSVATIGIFKPGIPGSITAGVKGPELEGCTFAEDCSDGNLCTQDICASGSCSNPPVDCSGQDGVCVVGMCQPLDGSCLASPTVPGSNCDDENACTTEFCDGAGSCEITAVDCSELDDLCVEGVCNLLNGDCQTQNFKAGSTCDDGDLCTIGDACDGNGSCAADPVDCGPPPSDCEQSVCNPVNGSCDMQPAPSGSFCDDLDPCTTESCDGAGACEASPVDCGKLDDDCNAGVCSAASGECEAQSRPAGTSCDDNDLCTTGDSCDGSGTCASTPVNCGGMDDACNIGVCNALDGSCGTQPRAQGTGCNDESLCTTDDACDGAGTCVGDAVDCSKQNTECVAGVCDMADGSCTSEPTNEGGACADGDNCTSNDTCQDGVCVGGSPDVCLPATPPIADVVAKNRYFSFVPGVSTQEGEGSVAQAFRVQIAELPAFVKWVGPPDAQGLSRLLCTAHYQDWAATMVHVGDFDVATNFTYVVQGIRQAADPADESAYTDPPTAIATVPDWGDVTGGFDGDEWLPPNQTVNLDDVNAAVLKFQGVPNAPPLTWTDVGEAQPNGVVNLGDAFLIVLAFQGQPYPYAPPAPCP